jgi:serine/threonine protein kinase
MIPETGRKLGPYEIQGRLGGGGMGHVFRAWDARLHREVAIKLLNHEYTMPGMRERFLREARAASALNHPNICTVFDIGEQDGDPYLVMELLQGENLKDRIQDRALPLDQIISIARDTAEGLGAAHAKGVVHRDIKPANIFLVEKPNGGIQAKVLDFGLAKVDSSASRGRALDLTTFGATVGTLAYMSPEQARGAAESSAGTGAGVERGGAARAGKDHLQAAGERAHGALPDGPRTGACADCAGRKGWRGKLAAQGGVFGAVGAGFRPGGPGSATASAENQQRRGPSQAE